MDNFRGGQDKGGTGQGVYGNILMCKKWHLLQKKCHPLQKQWHPQLKKFSVFLFK